MRTETVTVRIGEDVGPVDWTHPTAKDMPPIWREAAENPDGFVFGEYQRDILSICMYDGWPYWEPRPAVLFMGPLNRAEWAFFTSYGVGPGSIRRRRGTNEASSEAHAAPVVQQPREEQNPPLSAHDENPQRSEAET